MKPPFNQPPFSSNGHGASSGEPDPVNQPELDATEVDSVRQTLNRWTLPPDLARTEARQRLTLALDAEWSARNARLAAEKSRKTALDHPVRERIRWAWLILRAQFRLVSRLTWIATLFVMTLGYVVSLAMSSAAFNVGADVAFPFALIAPLVAALGVAFLYGLEIDPALELQLAAPVSPRTILLARLTLVFGFNLMLGLTGSIALTPLYPTMTLWSIVAQWLAPMAFLSALAFTLTALFFDSMMSSLICLFLWFALLLRHMQWYPDGSLLEAIPNLWSADFRLVMWTLAFALVALAISVAGDTERTVTIIRSRD